jgi:large subunit ribosomal protein L15
MELKDLRPAKGSTKARKRVGRGNGSGYGKTAGRGMNGQLSRSGGGKRPGFEGGQTPLYMRLPKMGGFRNINRIEYAPVNVKRIAEKYAAGDTVDAQTLYEKGIIKHTDTPVKVLGDGDIDIAVTVKVDKVSASAKAKIEAAGGKVETLC